MATLSELPSPPALPIIGSLLAIDGAASIASLTRFSAELGPIYRLEILGGMTVVLGGQKLVDEVCDEKRFRKLLHPALLNLRPAVGDGLFTADTSEPNWSLAHRILMPAFGPLGLREMFDKMIDIAEQMFARWERFGPDAEINVPDTMTRLTLDTLALCAFDYRFNSFYRDAMHPFVDAMVGTLVEAGARERRPAFVSQAMGRTRRKFESDIAMMHDLADGLLLARRAEGRVGARADLLDAMLSGADPDTGEVLSDENIRFQLVTFLIAGHETTSGLLSFAVHLLLQHPDVLDRARQEIDRLLEGRRPTLDDLGDLHVVEHILMETLRLWPTAPGFAVTPHEETTIGDGYVVKPGVEILVLLPALHRDPAVWGDDAEAFRPDRFADGAAARLPPNAWKPFGNGQRACIGRGFAMQEALIVMTLLLQRFDITAVDRDYRLKVVETLTIKPDNLRIRARRRPGAPIAPAVPAVPAVPASRPALASMPAPADPAMQGSVPLLVLHGGNSGSSLAFASRIAAEAPAHGFAPKLAALDAAAGDLPREGAVVVVTASYEGQPPDNARRFMAWLDAATPGSLAGVRFAVLGCGNRQWARTYQAIPKRVDATLAAAGAERLLDRGEADAAGDFIGAAGRWIETLWSCLDEAFGTRPPGEPAHAAVPQVERLPPLRPARLAYCLGNIGLTDPALEAADAKRHLEFLLPPGMTYRAGDHLQVMPANPPDAIARILRRLGLSPDERVVVRDDAGRSLPIPLDEPMTAQSLFAGHVELERPATAEQARLFAAACTCPPDRALAEALLVKIEDDPASAPGTLSLLERLPSCEVPLGALLAVLPPMTPRRYSISSSPLADPSRCSLTVAVLDRPARSGKGRHRGVASTHLAALLENESVPVAIQPGSPTFRLPADPAIPIVMIAAGSGIAPFRGFVEERAVLRERGARVGPALLFFGCRHPDADWLYRSEFEAWERLGVVDVRPVFSRQPVDGKRYVQDRVRADGDEIAMLVHAGANVYVCGDGYRMAPAVEDALVEICAAALGVDARLGRRWAARSLVARGRYGIDAFF